MNAYYVLKVNGEVRRIAKIVDRAIAFAWKDGHWMPMAGLIKIINDLTDYEEISKADVALLIGKDE